MAVPHVCDLGASRIQIDGKPTNAVNDVLAPIMNLDDQQLRHSETPSQLFTADVDVAIIGAGVAGLATAIQAADCGLDVLVIERKEFPRYKVCGGCLNLRSLQILGQIGVASSIWKRGGVTLDRMEWACNGKRVQLKLPGGLAISRLDLDECLAEQAELRGCKILSPATVRSVQPEPQLCTLNVSHDKALTQVRARVVVHAGAILRALHVAPVPALLPA